MPRRSSAPYSISGRSLVSRPLVAYGKNMDTAEHMEPGEPIIRSFPPHLRLGMLLVLAIGTPIVALAVGGSIAAVPAAQPSSAALVVREPAAATTITLGQPLRVSWDVMPETSGTVSLSVPSRVGYFFGRPATTSAGYDIIVIAGQSNSVGQGTGPFADPYASTTTDARIFQLSRSGRGIADGSGGSGCGQIDRAVIPVGKLVGGILYDGLHHWGTHCRGGTLGFGLSFARRYALEELEPGRKILIVPAGYGGTSVMEWQPTADKINPGTTYNLYQDMKVRVQTALSQPGDNRIVAVLWSQGESDALSMSDTGVGKYPGMTQSEFEQKLVTVFSSIRTDFPSAEPYPILAVRLAPNWTSWPTCNADGTVKRYRDIALGKDRAENGIAAVIASGSVGPARLIDSGLLGNIPDVCGQEIADTPANPHYSASAMVTLGSRLFDSWKDVTASAMLTYGSPTTTASYMTGAASVPSIGCDPRVTDESPACQLLRSRISNGQGFQVLGIYDDGAGNTSSAFSRVFRFAYPADAHASCFTNGVYIPDGESATFYTSSASTDCASDSRIRTCQNGVLSGKVGEAIYRQCRQL